MKVKGILALMVVVGFGLVVFAGCSKDKPAVQSTPAQTAQFVNAKCPIMGNVINPEKVTADLIKEFKGQKVAFCCAGCPDKWDALSDEEKAAKLLTAK